MTKKVENVSCTRFVKFQKVRYFGSHLHKLIALPYKKKKNLMKKPNDEVSMKKEHVKNDNGLHHKY
jgi:hypothetical protein